MSDNTRLVLGTTGDIIRDIDKGGVKTQVITLDLGGAGAESLLTGNVPVLLFGTQDTGGIAAISVDGNNLALRVTLSQHTEIHDGDTFRYCDSVTLGSGGTQDYLLITPNTTHWAHFTFAIDGIAITSMSVFEATDRVGTTPQTIVNANRNSSTSSTVLLYKGTSGGTTDGTLLCGYSSGSSQGQSKQSSSVSHDNEWILKQNTKYIFRITSGTAGNLCNIGMDWYEHTSGTA